MSKPGPCPWCKSVHTICPNSASGSQVFCDNCHARGPLAAVSCTQPNWDKTNAEACRVWNALRPPPGPLRTRPAHGDDYWRLMPTGGWRYTWTGSPEDFTYLHNGLAFATREALAWAQTGAFP